MLCMVKNDFHLILIEANEVCFQLLPRINHYSERFKIWIFLLTENLVPISNMTSKIEQKQKQLKLKNSKNPIFAIRE